MISFQNDVYIYYTTSETLLLDVCFPTIQYVTSFYETSPQCFFSSSSSLRVSMPVWIG